MTSTIFHDKSMLFLVLIVAFFVGASTTNAFMDDAFAGNHDNNGSNGCEKANPNAKSCEKNPVASHVTCLDCIEQYYEDVAARSPTALRDFQACNGVVERFSDEMCSDVPPEGV